MDSLFFLTFLYLSTITLLILTNSSTVAADKYLTAYDVIQLYNFPVGILPKGITGFELDESTGKFSVHWDATCSFAIEGSYKLSYQSTITGKISKNKLTNLEGVKVKLFLFWVDIVEVDRTGHDLQFSVGIASAGFSIDNFEESPQCGCGFNCGDKPIVRVELTGLKDVFPPRGFLVEITQLNNNNFSIVFCWFIALFVSFH